MTEFLIIVLAQIPICVILYGLKRWLDRRERAAWGRVSATLDQIIKMNGENLASLQRTSDALSKRAR